MNLASRLAIAVLLCAITWPALAAADYFWNCTTPNGIKYADASKCDKGDTAVKMMKGNKPGASVQTVLVRAAAGDGGERPVGINTGVCPTNPDYCTRPNYGVSEGPLRAQAIQQFMREKECGFAKRFPQRCSRIN